MPSLPCRDVETIIPISLAGYSTTILGACRLVLPSFSAMRLAMPRKI
jgi:hypothetical protein